MGSAVPLVLLLIVGQPTQAQLSTAASVGAGADFACARTAKGAVFCWGRNDLGQLGQGVSDRLPHPMAESVDLPEAAIDLSVGRDHACALTYRGAAYCWGGNQLWQLGIGPFEERCVGDGALPTPCVTHPVKVGTATRFRSISAGYRATCGVSQDQRAYCWGYAMVGRNLSDSAGFQRCGPPSTGLWCVSEPRPLKIAVLSPSATTWLDRPVESVALGASRGCATTTESELLCWGFDPGWGQGVVITPRLQGKGLYSASIGYQHACGLAVDYHAVCWGWRDLGALGLGGATKLVEDGRFAANYSAGSDVVGGHRYRSISAGWLHTCAVDRARQVWCWGANKYGQLGTGERDPVDGAVNRGAHPYPEKVGLEEVVSMVSAGVEHTCAATMKGEVYCWGRSLRGAVGPSVEDAVPRPVRISLPISR
jgi:alpha-tubulin suppressor-like RCC1 family protein